MLRCRRINTDLKRQGALPLAKIPQPLHQPINSAFPANVCLVAVALPDGYAQVSPRGSVMVLDDETLAIWERGKGSTTAQLHDGTKVTVYFRDPKLRESGMLPGGGIARFYGTAKVHKSGPMYDKIWTQLIQPEKDRDPEKKGYAVSVKVDRAEDLGGKALDIK
jgi:hypothetical protein